MATALALSGICFFALLIGDICCVPVQKGNDPAAYKYAGPGFGPQPAARSGHYSPPSYGQVLRSSKPMDAGSVQSSGHGPATYSGSGPSARGFPPIPAAYSAQYSLSDGAPKEPELPHHDPAPGPSSQLNTAAAQPGGYVQLALPDGAHEEQLPPEGFGIIESEYISPPSQNQAYQGGELSHYEHTGQHGYYEREREEQGSPPHPPPPPVFAAPVAPQTGFTSIQGPVLPYWDFYPYYYDYMFLMGRYPPGTYSHASTSFEHGHDGWRDVHYLRETLPYQAEPGKVPLVHTGQ